VNAIRVVIADDHAVVRRGLAMVLEVEPGIDVVGEANDGEQALQLARELQPDLVLLDMVMPNCSGPEAAGLIKAHHSGVRVLMLSGVEIDAEVFDTLENGVDGYLPKDVSPGELLAAIRTVADGKRFIHSAVTEALLDRHAAGPPTRGTPELSPREMEVLRLLSTAATYYEIGEHLFIAEETVRTHVKHILAKLGQPNRTQAVLAAVRGGLIPLN